MKEDLNLRVLIVDANYLMLRSFFGALNNQFHEDLIEYAWEIISNKMFDLINKFNVNQVYLVLEGRKNLIEKFRYNKKYKVDRKSSLPEYFREAFGKIRPISSLFGFKVIRMEDQEADDVIASMSMQIECDQIYVMTGDKDLFTLIPLRENLNVVSYNLEILRERELLKKFPIRSLRQLQDYLTLIGDASDSLPGVPGVGPKTASRLLKNYGSIDNLVRFGSKDKAASKVFQNIQKLFYSRFMIKLNHNLVLPDLKVDKPYIDRDEIIRFLEENRYYNLLTKLRLWWEH